MNSSHESPEVDGCGQALIQALTGLNGFYECPKDENGKRLGPLVGYAGRDLGGRQYVGDVYLNAAVLEREPPCLTLFVDVLLDKMTTTLNFSRGVFCAAPLGGMALAQLLAYRTPACSYIYPEKEVTALKTEHSREQTRLVFKRHSVPQDAQVVIVEDLCNNFSTTAQLIRLVESAGAEVVGIACLVNRSPFVHMAYEYERTPQNTDLIPIFTILDKPIPEYGQDDPAVAEDVARGNVVWKPKEEWPRLMEAMTAAAK